MSYCPISFYLWIPYNGWLHLFCVYYRDIFFRVREMVRLYKAEEYTQIGMNT